MSDTILKINPKSEQIDFLVCRKFPNAKNVEAAYCRPQPMNPVGNPDIKIKNDRIFAELELRYEAIQSYRKVLLSKTPLELELLYTQEHAIAEKQARLKAEQEENGRPYNLPNANADFEFWSKTKHWSLDEAIALSFGKNPRVVSWSFVAAYIYHASPFALKYGEIRELALRALQWKELFDPVLPGIFIAWARRLDIDFPKELEEKVIARGGNVGDWKTAYDNLLIEYNKLSDSWQDGYKSLSDQALANQKKVGEEHLAALKTCYEEIRQLKHDKLSLQTHISELGQAITTRNNEKPLNPKARESLLKLVIGMAMDGYGYVPNAAKSPIPKQLTDILAGQELTIDEDTVRKWLKEATELLPSETEIAVS